MLPDSFKTRGYSGPKQQTRSRPEISTHNGEILTRLTYKIGRSTGACRSATQALLNGADRDPELRGELLTGIEEELQDIELVLENVSAWRALELGTLTLRRRPVNLKQWLPSVLARWHQTAERRGLAWQVELPTYLPSPAADPDRLAQVLNNLMLNALDYTPCGGKITIAVGAQGREVWLEVSNTGPGLPPDELPRVFEPFFSSSHQGRFPQGVGLGLTVAKAIVDLHGGRLTVASEPGEGMRFRVWLPGPVVTA